MFSDPEVLRKIMFRDPDVLRKMMCSSFNKIISNAVQTQLVEGDKSFIGYYAYYGKLRAELKSMFNIEMEKALIEHYDNEYNELVSRALRETHGQEDY